MKRGLRQALVWLVCASAVALVAAGVWTASTDQDFRMAAAISLMAVAGLLALTGGNVISRAETMDTFAFLGKGPEYADTHSGDGLTGLGVFLFVSVPLFAAGSMLFGTG